MTLGSTRRIPYALPELYGSVHWGLPLAILTAIVMAAVLAFTKWGYEVRLSGANPHAARYAGIPVRRRIIVAMLISGGIAGAAGMLEVAGTVHRLQGGISNNFGYLGIMVAVLARGSCLGVHGHRGADGGHPQFRHHPADPRRQHQHGAGHHRADPFC